jgi:hypothetical protein
MVNSVNRPDCVSTSILPSCCLTMMSWLIERPSPVPSPAGLVVKKGLNISSFTSGGMPVPLSRMRISTWLPRFLVAALSTGSKSGLPTACVSSQHRSYRRVVSTIMLRFIERPCFGQVLTFLGASPRRLSMKRSQNWNDWPPRWTG